MTDGTKMPLRPCGDCTACCEGWLFSHTLDLKPGKPCQNCTKSGCAIYAERPQDPCRDFTCAWVHPESGLPDDMRPDRCGAIVKWNYRWNLWKSVAALPVGSAIPEDTLKRLIEHAKERAQPIIFLEHEFSDGQYVRSQQFATGPVEFIAEAKESLKLEDIWKSESG